MANFSVVNKALKTAYPELDVFVVRGAGYVYFDGNDGFDKINSIYVHPSSTSTSDLVQLALEAVAEFKEKQ